jgi:hypothetical protein
MRIGVDLSIKGTIEIPDSPAAPSADIILDYENDAYSVNGVDKVFADLFPAPTAPLELTAGVGLEIDGVHTSASVTLIDTGAIFSEIDPALGFTAVLSVDMVSNAADAGAFLLLFSGLWKSNSEFARGGCILNTPLDQAASMALTAAATPNVLATANFTRQGANKIAYTVTPTKMLISLNGGDAGEADWTGFDLATCTKWHYNFEMYGAANGGTICTKKQEIYLTPIIDPVALRALST